LKKNVYLVIRVTSFKLVNFNVYYFSCSTYPSVLLYKLKYLPALVVTCTIILSQHC